MAHRDTQPRFDPARNQAWHRFLTLAEQHFTCLAWRGQRDNVPDMVTLVDPATGHAVTLTTVEADPSPTTAVVLTLAPDHTATAHGPIRGTAAAHHHAVQLTLDPRTAACATAALHHPNRRVVPEQAWVHIPDNLATRIRGNPTGGGTTTGMLVLLDRAASRLATVGPFTDPATACAWHPAPGHGAHIERLLVPLHPVTSA